jgi:hypothetical protein
MRCTLPVCSIFLRIGLMCGAGDAQKLVIFCTCVLTRKMLVQLVNFENVTAPCAHGSARLGPCQILSLPNEPNKIESIYLLHQRAYAPRITGPLGPTN